VFMMIVKGNEPRWDIQLRPWFDAFPLLR